jgi:hypothetical protein
MNEADFSPEGVRGQNRLRDDMVDALPNLSTGRLGVLLEALLAEALDRGVSKRTLERYVERQTP